MSFFGFDTSLPQDDRNPANSSKGFFSHQDAFAGLSGSALDDTDALDFEETYDGLADQLDETDDAFNDDTFGEEPASQANVGRDFDFAGQTAKVAGSMLEEEMIFAARQPPKKTAAASVPKPSAPKKTVKPAQSGYESYAKPEYIPQLEANASLWGMAPKKPAVEQKQPTPQRQAPNTKMMSLEEVEAMMRAQRQEQAAQQAAQSMAIPHVSQYEAQAHGYPPPGENLQFPGFSGPPQILQRPQQEQRAPSIPPAIAQHQPPAATPQAPQILQRQGPPAQAQQGQRGIPTQPAAHRASPQPRQILQNPQRLAGQGQPISRQTASPAGSSHNRGPSFSSGVVTHPQQLLGLTEDERAAFLAEDAKRAKRNHKIHLLSKDNGLMTPQDKNFITRIQLQQLVTATGGLDDQGPETALNEDFYYQVYSQIRAGVQRSNPHQPASQFAQTYLFQTGGRWGRRGRGGADNHVQRMEQQVQRAVEAAKAKPKNKQLVIEGSLGKISFSNSKTPRPLLNIKKQNSEQHRSPSMTRAGHAPKLDYKATLKDIEGVYAALMMMEDHERKVPPPIHEGSEPEKIQEHVEWRSKIQLLNEKLWIALKVMEPIVPGSSTPHPFISFLSHPKGKKAIPRIFRHTDDQQRLTILTLIVVHLDTLDVIRYAVPDGPDPLSPATRESVDLFAAAVMPPLFTYVNEAPLNIVIGLLGLVLDRTNVHNVTRTRIGLSILTTILSRAELLKSAPGSTPQDIQQYQQLYNVLFDTVEPVLPHLFPPYASLHSDEDVYVWQFLAATGAGASPEQQQRLVLGVKERVMETVAVGRTLPGEVGATRLGHVNLFMRSIGLDVELLG